MGYTAPSPRAVLRLPDDISVTTAIRPYRVRRMAPCPVCGRDSECIAIPQDAVTHVWCTRVASAAVLTGWGFKAGLFYHRLDAAGAPTPLRPTYGSRPTPAASPSVQDRIYRALARACGLSEAHRAALVQRGYAPDSIGAGGRQAFASLPADLAARARVVVTLLASGAATGEADLLGTPGFSRDRRHGADSPIFFLPNVAGAALLEFRRDAAGRFTGLQFAPDTPRQDAKGKALKRETPQGMGISGMPHVAQPVRDDGVEIWHTEAIHKAHLTADARHAPATGALGVGSMPYVVPAALALDPAKRRRHIVAADADHWGGREERSLAHKLFDAGVRVALGRWDKALGNGPDDALAAGGALWSEPWQDDRPTKRGRREVAYAHPWQARAYDQAAHHAALADEGARLAARVAAHITAGDAARVLIIAAPPGAGKSHAVAALGERSTAYPVGRIDLAWITPRHDLAAGVPALATFQHIQPATPHNCSLHAAHDALGRRGWNTAAAHKLHYDGPCAYSEQFRQPGSAVYMTAHAETQHIKRHAAAIVDEFDLPTWLPELAFDCNALASARRDPADSTSDLLLRALQATITDAEQADTPLTDGALWTALDRRCEGHLAAWVGRLMQNDQIMQERPWAELDLDIDITERAAALPLIALPAILPALAKALMHRDKGEPWNGPLRITRIAGRWALGVTRRRQVNTTKPLTIVDATPDADLYARFFRRPLDVERPTITPPPGLRHIAVRTGARYGKLTTAGGKGLARTIGQARYLLNELDPDGALRQAGRVGLITFQGIEAAVGDALGIGAGQRGHFWGLRGSNRLEPCDVLIVLGTPSQRPDEVARIARALWDDDPQPLDAAGAKDASGHWRFTDPRMQAVADYLARAELSQCAHRNRPLRHDGRTVVTFCDAEIDGLPVTTAITSLPEIAPDGADVTAGRRTEAETRLADAARALAASGAPVTLRGLAEAAQVKHGTAAEWLRIHLQSDPHFAYRAYSTSGIVPEIDIIHPADAAPPDTRPPRGAFLERLDELRRAGLDDDDAIRRIMSERRAWEGGAA